MEGINILRRYPPLEQLGARIIFMTTKWGVIKYNDNLFFNIHRYWSIVKFRHSLMQILKYYINISCHLYRPSVVSWSWVAVSVSRKANRKWMKRNYRLEPIKCLLLDISLLISVKMDWLSAVMWPQDGYVTRELQRWWRARTINHLWCNSLVTWPSWGHVSAM